MTDYIALVQGGPPMVPNAPQFTICNEGASRRFVQMEEYLALAHRAE
ncbi:MAG: hypothetical protein ABI178_09385 [Rhodanobacter sp.]